MEGNLLVIEGTLALRHQILHLLDAFSIRRLCLCDEAPDPDRLQYRLFLCFGLFRFCGFVSLCWFFYGQAQHILDILELGGGDGSLATRLFWFLVL